MWAMLCLRAQDLQISYHDVQAGLQQGGALWTATYSFPATGRKVTNPVASFFVFENEKIIRHTDHFHFPRWAGQALGIPGRLLGRTSFFRRKVQQKAMHNLAGFHNRQSA